ncbi:hypothetical protein [Agarivorans gilvus]|uniref:Uncharacterized protein n=1 Tax=Agarivorans gilvus TaxID=680279 RepID=A0ABQ1I591_9ALTE|nr:hypothetical protein [Agarivorans gilvus]GGB18058.1 hypothetical protein GCM10007414_34320 [Agarivorans gilvus]
MRIRVPEESWKKKLLLVLVCMFLVGMLPEYNGFFRSDDSFKDTSEVCGTVTSYVYTGEGPGSGKTFSAWYLIIDNNEGRFEFMVDRPFILPYIPDFREYIGSPICIKYIPVVYSSLSDKFVVDIFFDGKGLLNESLAKKYYFTPISPFYSTYLIFVFLFIFLLIIDFRGK